MDSVFRDGLLQGQVALVTGGGTGIGFGIAMALAELGCDIILSQTTHDLLAGKYETEQLSTVQIKGKKEQVMIYKLGNFV